MNEWALAAIGLVFGGAVGWLLANSRRAAAEAKIGGLEDRMGTDAQEIASLRARLEAEQKGRAASEAALEGERKNLQEQRELLSNAQMALTDAFGALSRKVLGEQSETFLQLAGQKFDNLLTESKGDLSLREEAISGLVQPLKDALERYQTQIKEIELHRQEAYGSLKAHLGQLADANSQLQRETANLVTALRKPQVRGRWGEITLRRLAELSGMVDHCDFQEQPSVSSDDRLIRPDMIVHLPGGREVVVDSKVALDGYLDAIESPTEELRAQHLVRHAAQVRRHMEQLGSKSYWDRLPRAPEFVVLFLPGDAFLGAAVERDSTLIEDGMNRRVVISTPNTLVALLLAVYHGWRQEEIAKNAQEISELGKQLYKRVGTMWEHLDSLRSAIDKSVDAWNHVVGSLEHQVLPSVRKFRELKATTADEIAELEQVERTTRALPPNPQSESD